MNLRFDPIDHGQYLIQAQWICSPLTTSPTFSGIWILSGALFTDLDKQQNPIMGLSVTLGTHGDARCQHTISSHAIAKIFRTYKGDPNTHTLVMNYTIDLQTNTSKLDGGLTPLRG